MEDTITENDLKEIAQEFEKVLTPTIVDYINAKIDILSVTFKKVDMNCPVCRTKQLNIKLVECIGLKIKSYICNVCDNVYTEDFVKGYEKAIKDICEELENHLHKNNGCNCRITENSNKE